MVKERCEWKENVELHNVFDNVKGTSQNLRARQGQFVQCRTLAMIIAEPSEAYFGPLIIPFHCYVLRYLGY